MSRYGLNIVEPQDTGSIQHQESTEMFTVSGFQIRKERRVGGRKREREREKERKEEKRNQPTI